MNKIPSSESLLNYMLDANNDIRLSRYDKKFFNNINVLVTQGSSITENQNDLFNKLLHKYRRQFASKGILVEDITNLPWLTTQIVQSEPAFTHAFIEIVGKEIYFRSPYKIKFIEDLRQENYFEWIKDDKKYVGNYSTLALKYLYTTANKHFEQVHYCETTNRLLAEMEQYASIKYWQPTLVKVNDRLIIAAHNDILANAIKDIPIDYSLASLAKLVYYGVEISTDVTTEANNRLGGSPETLRYLDFATTRSPKFEMDQPELLARLLKQIGCDFVLIFNFRLNEGHHSIIDCLKTQNINCACISTDSDIKTFSKHNNKTLTEIVNSAKMPVQLNFKRFSIFEYTSIAKTINMVDSRPIETK